MTLKKLNRRGFVQAGAVAGAAAMTSKAAFAQDATPGASPAGSPAASPVAAGPVPQYDGSEVTITYGIWDSAQEEGVKKQIEAFKEVQPNITVELQVTPWSDYWTKLQTAVAGGEAFDVFWLNSANCPVYASAGALVPLTSLFEDGSIDPNNYPATVLDLYKWNGNHYGTPREYDTIGLFYNKDMFDKAGEAYPDDTWDWAKLLEVAKKFTDEGAGTWGLGLQNSWQENWYNFVYQNEGNLLNDDRTACVVADDANTAEALKWDVQVFLDKLTPGMDIQQSSAVEGTLFPAGQVAMMPGGSFRASTYAGADVKIDVAPLPKGKVNSCVIHGLGNCVWTGSKSQGAAVEFAKWLASEDAEKILGETGIGLPAYQGLESTWLDALGEMNGQVFVDAVEGARVVPDPEVGFQWQIEIMNVMDKGFLGETPKDDVPQAAQDAANAVL